MTINRYLKNKLSKQEEHRIMGTESVLMVTRWEGVGEWVMSEGIKKYKELVTE